MDAGKVESGLVEMGFSPDIAAMAARQPNGLKGAIEWLEQHNFLPAESAPAKSPSVKSPQMKSPPAPIAPSEDILKSASDAGMQASMNIMDTFSKMAANNPTLAAACSPSMHTGPAQQQSYGSPGKLPEYSPPLSTTQQPHESSGGLPEYTPTAGYQAPPDTKRRDKFHDHAHQQSYGSTSKLPEYTPTPGYQPPSDSKNSGHIHDHETQEFGVKKPDDSLAYHSTASGQKASVDSYLNAALYPTYSVTSSVQASAEDKEVGHLRSFFKRLGGDEQAIKKHQEHQRDKSKHLMDTRWNIEGSPTRDLVARYWKSTHMANHWDNLQIHHPHRFAELVAKGYCEPIPTKWVRDQVLAVPYPETYNFENPAEERLYYYLNNGTPLDGIKQPHLRPLNIKRDRDAIIRRGNERNSRAHPLEPLRLAAYQSPHDVFLADREINSLEYSSQVDNVVYDARVRALHELADGISHGTDHLETMLLLDVSGSMLWNPHNGIRGPDGVLRYHDQPANIELVKHLVHRVLYHMAARSRKEHPKQYGIDTVTFSTWGKHVGQMSPENFSQDWIRVQLGGGTQVMQGWQVVKNTYFEQQHKDHGHGRWDRTFGWQPTPGMPKLSLLVFLDGEALDMDEFELELLGETWAYVTIALVGMENCPHHHSHAVELERVARFNPHIGFFDVHGRVCERMVVEDLLRSVYPVDPPAYDEITNPQYDLPDEKLPSFKR